MSEDFANDKQAEEIFNAFQYLSMKVIASLTEIHSALPDGDIEKSRSNLEDIKQIVGLIEQAVNATSLINSCDTDFVQDEQDEDDEEIEDYLDEDFEDPISQEEIDGLEN